jgi:hypothetical protein
MNDIFILNDINYEILLCESKYIFHPEYFEITPVWNDDPDFEYRGTFVFKEYQLYLKSFIVSSGKSYPVINGVRPEPYYSEKVSESVQYNDIMELMKFTGAVIIGNLIVNDYGIHDKTPCFCYKNVKELIFHEGKLVTTIDHSRDMQRIRKNIDLGLRRLDKKQDINCINHFLKTSFVGEYSHPDKLKKEKSFKAFKNTYLEKIKKQYEFFKKKI